MLRGTLVTVCPQRTVAASLRVVDDLFGAVFGIEYAEYYFANVYLYLPGDAVGSFRAALGEDSGYGDRDCRLCVGGTGAVFCCDGVFAQVDKTNLFNV